MNHDAHVREFYADRARMAYARSVAYTLAGEAENAQYARNISKIWFSLAGRFAA